MAWILSQFVLCCCTVMRCWYNVKAQFLHAFRLDKYCHLKTDTTIDLSACLFIWLSNFSINLSAIFIFHCQMTSAKLTKHDCCGINVHSLNVLYWYKAHDLRHYQSYRNAKFRNTEILFDKSVYTWLMIAKRLYSVILFLIHLFLCDYIPDIDVSLTFFLGCSANVQVEKNQR